MVVPQHVAVDVTQKRARAVLRALADRCRRPPRQGRVRSSRQLDHFVPPDEAGCRVDQAPLCRARPHAPGQRATHRCSRGRCPGAVRRGRACSRGERQACVRKAKVGHTKPVNDGGELAVGDLVTDPNGSKVCNAKHHGPEEAARELRLELEHHAAAGPPASQPCHNEGTDNIDPLNASTQGTSGAESKARPTSGNGAEAEREGIQKLAVPQAEHGHRPRCVANLLRAEVGEFRNGSSGDRSKQWLVIPPQASARPRQDRYLHLVKVADALEHSRG
mmetsp:Transcript_100935/g.315398  ORF Transcript_100935/g.315398 Transcript_100935/m.315398 type:complete len:276 (+) Transcript_100935:363-1190(+)